VAYDRVKPTYHIFSTIKEDFSDVSTKIKRVFQEKEG